MSCGIHFLVYTYSIADESLIYGKLGLVSRNSNLILHGRGGCFLQDNGEI